MPSALALKCVHVRHLLAHVIYVCHARVWLTHAIFSRAGEERVREGGCTHTHKCTHTYTHILYIIHAKTETKTDTQTETDVERVHLQFVEHSRAPVRISLFVHNSFCRGFWSVVCGVHCGGEFAKIDSMCQGTMNPSACLSAIHHGVSSEMISENSTFF